MGFIFRRCLSISGILTSLVLILAAAFPAASSETDVTLSIPALNLRASVVEIKLKVFPDGSVSWDTANLDPNVGHLEGTAWLDRPGNIVLGGHSELRRDLPGIFADLDRIQVGDTVILSASGKQRRYRVTDVLAVEVDDLTAIYPTQDDRLTLITCDVNSYNPATRSYDSRLIVVAERVR